MDKEETDKANMPELLMQAGLPPIEVGTDGFPIPGKVVKYYREHMIYTNKDGKEKHWTQADLAERLGLKGIIVNLMENQNKGLNSIERRRALATILRIPPVLLGLGSLDIVVEIATGIDEMNQHSTERSRISENAIKQYQNAFHAYKKLYAEGLSYASVYEIERWTKRIEQATSDAHIEDKGALLQILWKYEILCAKIYGSDIRDWNKVFEHLDNAREISMLLDNKDLQAASLCHSGIFHFRQGRTELAKMDMDGALMYAKSALPQTRGIIYSKNACIRADDASISGITFVQNTFDESEKYINADSEITTITFGKDDYLLDKAHALLTFGRPAKALELIEDAERYIDPSKVRFLVFLGILQARCYIELKKPEYEQAVMLLHNALKESEEIRVARNMDHIEKLYKKIAKSSYGKVPEVIDLGLALQHLHMKN